VALRYANVYGPRQDPHGEGGVVAIFASRLASDQRCTINGTGEQTRDYVYVADVARANVVALEGGAPSGAYNVGTGLETSVNELYETMADLSGRYMPAAEHAPAKRGEQLRSAVDPAKAERVLGWRAGVGLREGLEKTLAYFGALAGGARLRAGAHGCLSSLFSKASRRMPKACFLRSWKAGCSHPSQVYSSGSTLLWGALALG